MKIALVRNHDACINTRQIRLVQRRAGVLPHLGLSYIEAALDRRGHHARTIDAQAEGLDAAGLRARLHEFGPDLVGVTTTTPGFPGALEACQIAKEIGATVILGGPHTEVYAAENLYHRAIDYVGVGEGASIMPNLADAIEAGESPEHIPGLVSRTFKNGPAPMLNLEDMGWPSRKSVPIDSYYSLLARRPFATMISSRGCPFQCSFCFKQAVDKRSIYRSAEDVVGEMEHLHRDYGVKEIMFYDDVFTMKRKRVVEICELIRARGLKIRWEAPTRVDLVDEELLRMMAAAGCIRLRFGIESGDVDILRSMQKKTDLEAIEQAVRATKRAGIQCFAYFIVGWLDETDEQFNNTAEMALRLPLDYASFYTATPLPGTKLHADAIASGKIDPDYWLKYIRGEATQRIGLLTGDAEARSRIAYRKFYLRPSKAPMLVRQLARRHSFTPTITGLASLLRSDANAVRDM